MNDLFEELRALDREPSGPSGVDVGRAMAVGTRHRRRRQAALVGSVAAATVLVLVGAAFATNAFARHRTEPAGPPGLPTSCRALALETPPGMVAAWVTAADPTGRYLLGRGVEYGASPGSTRGVIWHDGLATVVDGQYNRLLLRGVTSTGLAVGRDEWTAAPVIFQNGVVHQLPGPPVGGATAVNEAGVIVGWVARDQREVPVRWPSADASPVDLAVPEGAIDFGATAVSADGIVVGTVQHAGAKPSLSWYDPYVWYPDGTGHVLDRPLGPPVPDQPFYDNWAHATAISGDWVFGDQGPRVVIWNLRTGAVQSYTGDFQPRAVNVHGWIAMRNEAADVIVKDGNRTLTVGQVISRDDEGVYTLSDDGRTVTNTTASSFQNRTTAWRCS